MAAGGTLVASQSVAAAATLTSAVFPFDPSQTIQVTMANGSVPPGQQVQVALQLSVDNVTWREVDRRSASASPSGASYQTFLLQVFTGNMASYMGGVDNPQAWGYYRLVFAGHTDQAVTVAASVVPAETRVSIPLTGTTVTTGGGIAAWTPPQGGPIIITSAILYIKTASTGAAAVNVGIAANATTSSATLLSAQSVAAANVVAADLAPATPKLLQTTNVVTVSSTSDTTGFVGTLFLKYIQP